MDYFQCIIERVTLAFGLAVLGLSVGYSAARKIPIFHVATDGNDTWSGTLAAPNAERTDGPLLTLVAARDRIRAARKEAPSSAPTTVLIREGVYQVSGPFVLLPEDSGSSSQPVVYAAYPREHPVISGGRRITGWERGQGNVWSVEIPEVREGTWYFRELFVNRRRAQRARIPNFGFYRLEGPQLESKPLQIRYKSQEIKKSWAERGDVEIVALFAWSEIRMPVRQVDERARLATLSGDAMPSNKEVEARYYIENAPEGLDSPGEWHLDRKSGVLSYWPVRGEDPNHLEVTAPVTTQLVQFEGHPSTGKMVRNIVLRGITFREADWSIGPSGYADVQAAVEVQGALKATGAVDCTLEKCVITAVGGYAVEFGEGCKRNRIVRNEIFDAGAGGIKLGQARGSLQVEETPLYDNEEQRNSDNTISDNQIYDLGTVFPAGVGVWIGQSIGSTVSHNHIYDLNYTAISVGWNWGYGPNQCHHNIIEYNHLHHVGRGMLSDLGAIYTLGIQPGTVIRNNLIHDVESFSYGGWGIYTDEGSSNILIENNVIYRTNRAGFHQHYGRENIVRNNVFAFAKEHQVVLSKLEDHLSFTFERNIVYWTEGQLFGGRWAGSRLWPDCKPENTMEKVYAHAEKDCKHFRIDHNLYYDTRGGKFPFYDRSFAAWQQQGNDLHSTVADPLFINPSSYQFGLQPGSPAFKLGFKPIDLTNVGPRPETTPF